MKFTNLGRGPISHVLPMQHIVSYQHIVSKKLCILNQTIDCSLHNVTESIQSMIKLNHYC